MDIPITTYRLQLTNTFKFVDASKYVDFFKTLGISHLYLSPPFEARTGSSHHYDIVDPTIASAELGGENEFEDLVKILKDNGMGILLDIVPNHMCVSDIKNMLWADVLKNGKKSSYSIFFDIEWDVEIEGKKNRVFLPFLGGDLEGEIRQGHLKLKKHENTYFLHYYGACYPIAEESLDSLGNLSKLVCNQHYWLDNWRRGATDLNYRRFFDVSELAGVCVEVDEVFNYVHQTIKRWCTKGMISGVRIDHIDGLRDPVNYCRKLKSLIQHRYVVAEKILVGKEELDPQWDVEGTTGYDFLNLLNGLFVDESNWEKVVQHYRTFINDELSLEDHLRACKETVIKTTMLSEIYRLIRKLKSFNADINDSEAFIGLIAFVVEMPVYRTYFNSEIRREEDVNIIHTVLKHAQKQCVNMVGNQFWLQLEDVFSIKNNENALDFIMTLQQVTGAIMAKGVEDTFNYRFFPLASTNEVGSDPKNGVTTIKSFHNANLERLKLWPYTMLTTSTHDTKRSEDVRARINVLSEIPEHWNETVKAWHTKNAALKKGAGPDANDEYLLYQTLVGTWDSQTTSQALEDYVQRIIVYMVKAMREGKRRTCWINPNEEYETSVEQFIRDVLSENSVFKKSLTTFVNSIKPFAYCNSLSQVLLKSTVPGVPDFYQGSELWLLTLVDPDNRKQVNFSQRESLLDKLKNQESLGFSENDFTTGMSKLFMTSKLLQCRQKFSRVFLEGTYHPLEVEGRYSENVIAFARVFEGKSMITVATRSLKRSFGSEVPLGNMWKDTSILLEGARYPITFIDHINGVNTCQIDKKIQLSDLFTKVPMAFLEVQ